MSVEEVARLQEQIRTLFNDVGGAQTVKVIENCDLIKIIRRY